MKQLLLILLLIFTLQGRYIASEELTLSLIHILQTISIMDYIGTFAFALSGAYLAIRYELDIFGIFVCAFSTACGGGIRCV